MASFITGNTGSSTAEHLDFRVYDVNKGAYTDPSRFTSRMRVGDGLLTDQFSVTSPHGMRNHPTKGGQRMHHGIDYGTPTGTAVTIEGGKFLTTFNDPGGGGITSQYSITDDEGNPFEILLMHGSADNQVLSDGAITNGMPSGADPSTPSPIADQTVVPATTDYSQMTGAQMNQAYDKLRMAGDIFKAENEGLKMHKAHMAKR